jgi:mannose-6-phosphate isomerase class I
MSIKLYPLLFEPVLKDYIWGGRNLETILGRTLPPGKIAESWEIAAHKDGTTAVANGRFAGTLLTDLHQQLGLDLIGSNNQWAQERDKFPLLIKLLDAHQPLSVQVHPDDAYALAHEGNELGKAEMWVVLRASEEAAVILGVSPKTTPAAFRQAIEAGNLEPICTAFRSRRGMWSASRPDRCTPLWAACSLPKSSKILTPPTASMTGTGCKQTGRRARCTWIRPWTSLTLTRWPPASANRR